MNPYDKAHELARSVVASDAYVKAKAARERLERDPSALRMAQDIRTRQWALQAKVFAGQTPTREEEETLQRLMEVVSLNSDVREYLQAEYQLSVLLADIQRILADAARDAMLPDPMSNDFEQ